MSRSRKIVKFLCYQVFSSLISFVLIFCDHLWALGYDREPNDYRTGRLTDHSEKSVPQARQQTAYEEKLEADMQMSENLRNRSSARLTNMVKRSGLQANQSAVNKKLEQIPESLKEALELNQLNLDLTRIALQESAQEESAKISAAGHYYVHEKTVNIGGREVTPVTHYFMGVPVAYVGVPDRTKRMSDDLLLDFKVGPKGVNPYLQSEEGLLQADIDRVAREAGIRPFDAGYMNYFVDRAFEFKSYKPAILKEFVRHQYRTNELRSTLNEEVSESENKDVRTTTYFKAHDFYDGSECPDCLKNAYRSYFKETTLASGEIEREEVSNIQYLTSGDFKGQVREQEKIEQNALIPGMASKVTESFLYTTRPVTTNSTDQDKDGTLGDGKDILITEINRSGVRDFSRNYADDFEKGELPQSVGDTSREKFKERIFDMSYDNFETLTHYKLTGDVNGVRQILEFDATRSGDVDILGRYVHFKQNQTAKTETGDFLKLTQDRTVKYDILDRIESYDETLCVDGFSGCSQITFTANRYDSTRPWVLLDFTQKAQYTEDGASITETLTRTIQKMDFDFNTPLQFTDVIVKKQGSETTTERIVTVQTLDVHGLLTQFQESIDKTVDSPTTSTHQKIVILQNLVQNVKSRETQSWTLSEETTTLDPTTGAILSVTTRDLSHSVSSLEEFFPANYTDATHDFNRTNGIHPLSFLTGESLGLPGILNSIRRSSSQLERLFDFEILNAIELVSLKRNLPYIPEEQIRELKALPILVRSVPPMKQELSRPQMRTEGMLTEGEERVIILRQDSFGRSVLEYGVEEEIGKTLFEMRVQFYDLLTHSKISIPFLRETIEWPGAQGPLSLKQVKRAARPLIAALPEGLGKIKKGFVPLSERVRQTLQQEKWREIYEPALQSLRQFRESFLENLPTINGASWNQLRRLFYAVWMRSYLTSSQLEFWAPEGVLSLSKARIFESLETLRQNLMKKMSEAGTVGKGIVPFSRGSILQSTGVLQDQTASFLHQRLREIYFEGGQKDRIQRIGEWLTQAPFIHLSLWLARGYVRNQFYLSGIILKDQEFEGIMNLLRETSLMKGKLYEDFKDVQMEMSHGLDLLSQKMGGKADLDAYTERALAVRKWIKTYQQVKDLGPREREIFDRMILNQSIGVKREMAEELLRLGKNISVEELTWKEVHPIIVMGEPAFLSIENFINPRIQKSQSVIRNQAPSTTSEASSNANLSQQQGGVNQ
ncbi:MAG: hypothetical protein HYS07_09265 [Chlamydiae bacterium]|nr:hypothetical protein [Chlamydiota bacterium]MBI3277725.1 hypothetical protein [Chlamydiota bacterium]